jgi:hypothetical protein
MIFLAGSLVRGEGTRHSDLDLVVIFDRLERAYRESFHMGDLPVEAFVHDPQTLEYFFYEVDARSGVPALAQMIVEGVEIPASSELSRSLKQAAALAIETGPPELTDDEMARARYTITNLVDDIREPRTRAELVASGAALYQELADFYLRANKFWSAKDKSIPRILLKADPGLCTQYIEGFDALLAGDPKKVIDLAGEILRPHGGFLFDGHRLDAPADHRKSAG